MVSFLLAELRLGMTFVNIADHAKGGKRRRYLGNAKEAYYNVVRLAGRAGLAGEDLHEVEVMLDTLKEAAEQVEPW